MSSEKSLLNLNEIKDSLLFQAIHECEERFELSYSPYSGVKVIAAAILDDDQIIFAGNQENLAFPSGVCAEVNLLTTFGSNYVSKKIKTIIVRGFKSGKKEIPFISPCGNCRQVMIEFESRQDADIEVVFGSLEKGFYRVESVKELLPFYFSNDSFDLM